VLGAAGAREVARGPLQALTFLHLGGTGLRAADLNAEAFAHLPQLEDLRLGPQGPRIGLEEGEETDVEEEDEEEDEEAAAAVEAAAAAAEEEEGGEAEAGPDFPARSVLLDAVLASRAWPRLARLDLAGAGAGAAARAELAAGSWPALARLGLEGCDVFAWARRWERREMRYAQAAVLGIDDVRAWAPAIERVDGLVGALDD
jgi:hypothetical protein